MVANINLGGTLSAASLIVPGAYVNVLAPPPVIAGVNSSIMGVVGTASWGPVNSPFIGSYTEVIQAFGNPVNRLHDLCTGVWIGALQAAAQFAAVRVTDGTDTAASGAVNTTGLTLTAKYTGTTGNGLTWAISAGTASGSWKLTLGLPGQVSEVYDNLTGTGNAFWVAAAAAINSGQNISRGPSALCVASAGASTVAPAAPTSGTLSGGADGATTITSSVLIGQDTASRKGMYALRNSGAAVAFLMDCADPTTWSTQLAFGLSEQLQMVDCTPAGDTLSTLATEIAAAATNSPYFKALFGDWCYFADTINGVTRLVSPTAFYAGAKVANGPQNSALNQELYGIVATQKTEINEVYSNSDLATLAALRVDVISSPSPGGDYYSCLLGCNTSSNAVELDDSYATLTNFLALSLGGPSGGGQFVGQLGTPDEVRKAKSGLSSFLGALADAKYIGNAAGTKPYSVAIATNPNGVQVATVAVQYFTVIRFFVINLTAGATVTIATSATAAAAAAATATA